VKIDGFTEAKSWVINVKKYPKWAIFESTIKIISEKFLDLVENIDHKRNFEKVRNKILQIYDDQRKPRNTLRDYIVFRYIEEQSDFDFIRALVDAGRQEYSSFIVGRPQIQICVKQKMCIADNKLILKG
jgi:hypothetical protein